MSRESGIVGVGPPTPVISPVEQPDVVHVDGELAMARNNDLSWTKPRFDLLRLLIGDGHVAEQVGGRFGDTVKSDLSLCRSEADYGDWTAVKRDVAVGR